MNLTPFVLAMAVLGSAPANAQIAPKPACAAPEFRQFDFWKGEWDVTSQGHPAGHWEQFWVDGSGTPLHLIGGITWTPNADGSVRQLLETSNGDGKTWAVTFDGLYKPALVPSPSRL